MKRKDPASASFLEAFVLLSGYRVGMRVTQLRVFPSSNSGESGYYICPRCGVSMSRELISFCDRCGQRLDWRGYRKAKRADTGGR